MRILSTVVIVVCVLALCASMPSLAASPVAGAGPPPAAAPQVVVYYFHGEQRCPTCLHIESATEQTLRTRFAAELADKRVEWRVVNFDEPANEHVIKDYGLVAQSVVLVERRDGKQVRFKNLDQIWRLIHDDAKFAAYIQDEVRAFLKDVHA